MTKCTSTNWLIVTGIGGLAGFGLAKILKKKPMAFIIGGAALALGTVIFFDLRAWNRVKPQTEVK